MRKVLLAAAAAMCCGCGKKEKGPYEVSRPFADALGEIELVVNGTAIKGKDRKFFLPKGMEPDAVKTVAFRYQTPCGAYEPALALKPLEKHHEVSRVVEVVVPDGAYVWKHPVIIDKSGQDKVEVKIGKLATSKGADSSQGSSLDGWDKARVDEIFGVECGASHEVTVDGTPVGTIAGVAPEGTAIDGDDKYGLPIFVTGRSMCFRFVLLAVDQIDRKSGATMNRGDAFDRRFRGPGAFYIPLVPDLFMKEPSTADEPSGLYEVPCETAPASAEDAAPPPAPQ